ncbi:MAG: hypothetical protein L6277_03590 [Desulfobacterales bacterium]|nr:hypothetical protein [Pseudomonadota bacterium]MBU4355134.1 hypothetical protein [Pseudomonadota bacterium]MCG2771158.1 hypothetical protein [Desulfobacterales bacterium]
MRRSKANIVLTAAIPVLLVLAIVVWSAGSREVCRKIDRGPDSPLMTHAAISGWEGAQRLYQLEMAQLNLVPKRWGPFEYEDCFDLAVRDCRLQVNSDALASTLKNVGETLLLLGRRPQPSALPAVASDGSEPENSPGMTLVGLPPKIEARKFSCRITYPNGQILTISAALATLDPPNPFLDLEGDVRVQVGGTSLQAEAACWAPLQENLLVLTPYTLISGNQHRRGCNAPFSLAAGELKPLPPSQAGAAMVPPRVATPAQALSFKHLFPWVGAMKSNPMSGTLLTTLQARAEQGVMPLPANGPTD